MMNTLPHLMTIPAQVLVSLGILFFFAAKAIPSLRDRSPVPLFYALLAACFVLEGTVSETGAIFGDMLYIDSFGRMLNQVVILATAVTVFMMGYSTEMNRKNDWENFGLILTLLLGMMLMSVSVNLLMAVISIELVSFPSYLLVALNRKDPASKEASLKYVLFGSFATGIMLYGMSFIFGLSGSLHFEGIWRGLNDGSIVASPVYLLAITMTLGGIAFKIAAVPFHFWCPDAYQAAPTPVTSFLSIAPKVAGLALLIRFLSQHFTPQANGLMEIIAIIAMITMTLGNLAALKQTNIKRLMAYSSISHAGFFLMGVATLDEAGRQAVYFYIPVYLLMNIAAFMGVILLGDGGKYEIKDYKGVIKKSPFMVVLFTISIFSLAGVPPFAGFIGKFYLFKVVLEKDLWLLAVVAGANSVVALYYYVNILKVMIIDEPDDTTVTYAEPKAPLVLMTFCAAQLVVFGLYWRPILDWAKNIQLF